MFLSHLCSDFFGTNCFQKNITTSLEGLKLTVFSTISVTHWKSVARKKRMTRLLCPPECWSVSWFGTQIIQIQNQKGFGSSMLCTHRHSIESMHNYVTSKIILRQNSDMLFETHHHPQWRLSCLVDCDPSLILLHEIEDIC